jgi:hypothetical protein
MGQRQQEEATSTHQSQPRTGSRKSNLYGNWVLKPVLRLLPEVPQASHGYRCSSMLVQAKARTAPRISSLSIGMAISRDWLPISGRWLGRMFSLHLFINPSKLIVETATLTGVSGSPSMLSTTTHYLIHKASSIRPPNTSMVSLISTDTHTSALSEVMSAMSVLTSLC